MDTNEFKKIFSDIAKENGFEKSYGGWFKEFDEVVNVLDLQKSNYGNYYYLNIKIFVHGTFGNRYVNSKQLIKSVEGDIYIQQSKDYNGLFDLDSSLKNEERKHGLEGMFKNFIVPFSEKTNSKEKIKKFYKEGGLFILPAVRRELGITDL